MFPITGPIYKTVLNRIVMDVIDVIAEIIFVPYHMIPEAKLPDPAGFKFPSRPV
jgi:hypothetical protein